MRSKPDIAAEVAALRDLPREELVDRWRRIYGSPPPKGVRQDLLIRAAAWHLQAKRLGGLPAETRRLLRSAISRVEGETLARGRSTDTAGDQQRTAPGSHEEASAGHGRSDVTSSTRQRRQVGPGTRLIREWNGQTHVVGVIEGGYVFETKVYPSLTAIAGKITGVHWSGPRFFGL
jgi:hypothetical protein